MAAPTIIGTTVLVGFSGETVSGIIRDSQDIDTTADIEYIRSEDNEEGTALVSNKGQRITVEGTCTTAVTIKKGDTVTINSVSMLVEEAKIRESRLATRFTSTGYKPDGLNLGGGGG